MSPHPESEQIPTKPHSLQPQGKSYKFIYKSVEYDCTDYVDRHPGGQSFFDKMVEEKKDFTEYFRALHSKKALKILKSQKKIQTNLKESQGSLQYTMIKKQIKHLFEPDWIMESLFIFGLCLGMFVGVTSRWYVAIPTLALVQIIAGWVGHSMNHNRNPLLYKLSTACGILHGLSTQWWQFKHNNHHMFTNRIGKDDDINHTYYRWQYAFLYLKWKYDSIITGYNKIDILFITLHWIIMLQQKLWITSISMLIGGFFSAHVLIGNHEREFKFFKQIDKPFIEHQIIACRNYAWTDWLSNVLMGGMQFQTEHHLFPQIPFYRLPYASVIIRKELAKFGFKVNVDSIL